ncbi:TPA: hypothetical protein PXN54_004456 [Yersinia enterocolitica]|nr:hypothetical protein [Yersinia enterocolitica]
MIITPQYFIIAVYGLGSIFKDEPVYIIYRESDGISISYTFDYDEASLMLIRLSNGIINAPNENLNFIESDIENVYAKKILELIIPGHASYLSDKNKVIFNCHFLPPDVNASISILLQKIIEKMVLKNFLPKGGKFSTPS